MKNIKIKQLNIKSIKESNIIDFFYGKIIIFQDMIQNTIIMAHKYKILNIFGARELNICIQGLNTIFMESKNIQNDLLKKKKKI